MATLTSPSTSLNITSKTFDAFGENKYHKIKQSTYNFIEDICDFTKNSTSNIEQFKNYCQQIMNDDMKSINVVTFSDLLFRLTNHNSELLGDCIIELFNNEFSQMTLYS